MVAPPDAEALTKSLLLGDECGGPELSQVLPDLIGADPRFDQAQSAAVDVTFSVPALTVLTPFDSVLVYLNCAATSSVIATLADRLREYADQGGRVVLSTFWGYRLSQAPYAGGINAPGYNPVTSPTDDVFSSHTLGAHDATSPLMDGVTALSSSFYNGDYQALADGATVVASWDDGRPLVAHNAARNVIAITILPAHAIYAQFGEYVEGDFRRLFANALAADLTPPSPPRPDPGPEYVFSGFFRPVDNLPAVNRAKAGRAIPVKFSLGADFGLDILAPGSPTVSAVSCSDGSPIGGAAVSAGGALSYDAATDVYTFVWKTDKAWTKACRTLVLTLKDGSEHRARFDFAK